MQSTTSKSVNSLAVAAQGLLDQPRRLASRPVESLSLVWEGTQFRHHSLAVVNREICSRLIDRGHDLEARLYEDHQFDSTALPRFRALEERFGRPCRRTPSILVRHQWPPNFADSEESVRVMIQPWEFGSVPKGWVEEMKAGVDELWVPSRYNRQSYIDGGLAPDRVRVIPNGVDLDRFHPDVAPMRLDTRKSVKFLFVGGTILRKGIKVLLSAYCQAFGPDDDVCLIIKDVGARSVYEGSTAGAQIRALAARPDCPEILYIDRDLEQEELVSLYRAADALVHPYLGEGFGMPIVEAMACGLPVIVTALGAAMDFCSRDNAWLIPATRKDLSGREVSGLELTDHPWMADPKVDLLIETLRQATKSPELRRARGRAGRLIAEREFSWDQVADLVEARLAALDRRAAPAESSRAEEIVLESQAVATVDGESEDLDAIRRLQDAFRPAVSALAAGDLEAAETGFRALVTDFPDLAAAHAGLGRTLLQAGKTLAAIAELEEALRILPGDRATQLDLASAEIAIGNSDQARDRLQSLVAADENEIAARILLASLARDESRFDEAAEHIAEVLAIEPDHREALQLFAVVARDLGYREGFDRARDRLARHSPEASLPSWI